MNGSEDVDFDFFDTPRNEGTESSAIYTQSGGASAKPPRGSKHVASNSEEKRHAKEIDNSPRKGGRNEDRRSDDDYSSDSSSSFESDSETPRMKRAPANTANRKDKQVSRGRMLPESPESSSAYSDSGSESADNFYDEEKGHGDHPREKINVTLPKTVQAWGSEEKHNKDKRHESHKEQEKGENYKQSSTKKRRDHKEEKYSNRKGNSESDSDSSVESKSKEKFGKRRTKVRNGPEKSDQNKRQPLKSASSSHSNNSDITDVSPLESPDVSPREARKRYDNVQYGAKVTSKPDVDIQLETDKIDLSILMKCMADIDREKQQRLKANSRRVMFAPPSHNDKPKPNYTFSSSRARMIEKENQRLLQQIMHHVQPGSKKLKPGSATKPLPKKAVEPVIQRLTPSAVNRQRHQRKIEMENMVYINFILFVPSISCPHSNMSDGQIKLMKKVTIFICKVNY